MWLDNDSKNRPNKKGFHTLVYTEILPHSYQCLEKKHLYLLHLSTSIHYFVFVSKKHHHFDSQFSWAVFRWCTWQSNKALEAVHYNAPTLCCFFHKININQRCSATDCKGSLLQQCENCLNFHGMSFFNKSAQSVTELVLTKQKIPKNECNRMNRVSRASMQQWKTDFSNKEADLWIEK